MTTFAMTPVGVVHGPAEDPSGDLGWGDVDSVVEVVRDRDVRVERELELDVQGSGADPGGQLLEDGALVGSPPRLRILFRKRGREFLLRRAARDLPPYDRATMDGIAIAYAAWESGTRAFRVAGTMRRYQVPTGRQGSTCSVVTVPAKRSPRSSTTPATRSKAATTRTLTCVGRKTATCRRISS